MQQLLLLHGAIGAKDQLEKLIPFFDDQYSIHTLNFSGHGGDPIPSADFSIPLFAGEVINYLDKQGIASVNIFGYSMGGYVAMYLAKYHPQRIDKIILKRVHIFRSL